MRQKTKIINNCYQNDQERMILRMNVKVLGGEYITDFAVIDSYGIMSTPALIVDEKIVSMGKVLKSTEIENFLK